MPRFLNIWDDPPGIMSHECVDCNEVVHTLQEMQEHQCKEPANASASETEADHTTFDPDYAI